MKKRLIEVSREKSGKIAITVPTKVSSLDNLEMEDDGKKYIGSLLLI